jgi:hypothetical protein
MLLVPTPLRERIGDSASEGLMTMFADAHRLATESFERRILEVNASFEHRLAEEIGKLRVDMVQQLAAMRFDLLKWSFLFWIGQLAGILAVLSLVLDSR